MFDSKALKEPERKKSWYYDSKLYAWWVDTELSGYYYSFTYKFIENPIFQVKRLVQWYWNVFRNDYDFDGHCLYAIIEYKLKRLEKVLLNGHAIQQPQDMKALKLAIKIAGRLREDKYEEAFFDRFDKKWGEIHTWFEPCNDGSDRSFWRSSRPNVKTEEDKAQESADRTAGYESCHNRMKREEKWLYAILHKYLRYWWD